MTLLVEQNAHNSGRLRAETSEFVAVQIYDLVGGEDYFVDLVDKFYQGVEADPLLRPLYPEQDLTGAKRRLHLFLTQYFGGPQTYSAERGHPRLRQRHMPFAIGLAERDAWMKHMISALRAVDAPEEAKIVMLDYFDRVASFMVNRE